VTTTVVNIKHEIADEYIGRPSMFGNPFQIGYDGDRKEVIKKYNDLFATKIQDSTFRTKVLQLKDKKLGCFCKPEACHGDIIAHWIDSQ